MVKKLTDDQLVSGLTEAAEDFDDSLFESYHLLFKEAAIRLKELIEDERGRNRNRS